MKKLGFLFAFFVFSCTSMEEKIKNLHEKTPKVEVIKRLGLPHQVGREEGFDLWTYTYKRDQRHYKKILYFKEGLLYKQTPRLKHFIRGFE